MSYTADLLRGVLQHLAAGDVGRYRPATEPGPVWGDDEIALVAKRFPQEPDRAVAVQPYPVSDDPRLSDSITGLQVRIRGHRAWDDVEDIGDAVFGRLQGTRNLTLPGGVRVVSITFQSGVPAGLDSLDREELVQNYYVRSHRPSPNRT